MLPSNGARIARRVGARPRASSLRCGSGGDVAAIAAKTMESKHLVQDVVAQGKQSVRHNVHKVSPSFNTGFIHQRVEHNFGAGRGLQRKHTPEVCAYARIMQVAVRHGRIPREQG